MLFSQVTQSHLWTNAHPQRKTSKKIWRSEEDGDLTWTNIYRATSNHPNEHGNIQVKTCGTAKPKYVSFIAFHNLSTMSSMIHNRISTTLKWPPSKEQL
jgi:hypothetical protein